MKARYGAGSSPDLWSNPAMPKSVLLDAPQPDKYPEVHFDVSGVSTWVHFVDDAYEDWIGVFGRGDIVRNKSFAVSFNESGCALVSAWGRGYVVDVNARTLKYRTDSDMLVDAIKIPNRELVIACDFTDLYAFTCEAQIWCRKRIASDGIGFIEASPDALTGRAYFRGKWVDFSLDLASWVVTPDLNAE
jgi:hypothetical protein